MSRGRLRKYQAALIAASALWLFVPRGASAQSACPPSAPTERTLEEALDRGRAILAAYHSPLKAKGLLDVTAPPYNAAGDGKTDDTCALQRALDDGRDARLTVYLPAGTYLVSKTLQGVQYRIDKDHKTTYAEATPFAGDMRHQDFPIIVTGPSRGHGRARIRLADGAFDNASGKRPILYLWARGPESSGYAEQPNTAYSLLVSKLEIITGNNPDAIGLDLQGAQNTAIGDVHVDARGGYAGFRGLPGSGGSAAHLSVQGGQYGIYAAPIVYDDALELSAWHRRAEGGAQPGPVIAVATLWGQSKAAIRYDARGPLVLAGAHIQGKGIEVSGARDFRSGLIVVDSVLDVQGGAAITTNRPVFLERTYVRGASTVAEVGATTLAPRATGWTSIEAAALSPSLAPHPIYLQGTKRSNATWTRSIGSDAPNVDELQAVHSFGPETFPAWDQVGVIDVTEAPYNVDPHDDRDDHAALQRAIAENAHRPIFLPKGAYYLSKPLELGAHTQLVGAGSTYSALLPLPGAAPFADASNPQPVVRTADDAAATTVLASLRIFLRQAGAYALHWRAGQRSIYRNNTIRLYPWNQTKQTDYPMVRISGNGGGRLFHLLAHQYILNMGPNHRELLVEGTRQPLVFYQLNPEHGAGDLQVELRNVQNVTIYNLKSEIEGQYTGAGAGAPSLGISGQSNHVALYGFSGLAAPDVGHAIIEISEASNFHLVDLQPQTANAGAFTLREVAGSSTVTAPNEERVAYYRRGNPQALLPLPIISSTAIPDGGVADSGASDGPAGASHDLGAADAGAADTGARFNDAGTSGEDASPSEQETSATRNDVGTSGEDLSASGDDPMPTYSDGSGATEPADQLVGSGGCQVAAANSPPSLPWMCLLLGALFRWRRGGGHARRR